MKTDGKVLLGLAGDILVDRPNPDEVFDLARDSLAVPDLLIANCECAYATNVEFSPGVTVPVAADPDNIPAIARAGFKVLGLANNHALDAGHRGLYEMYDHFANAGIVHAGTGRTLAEARRPAISKAGDLTVATLAYASFFPRGYEALDDWPGLAPIRAFNHYRERLPNVWSAGTPPIITTIPHEEDMANLKADIIAAKAVADIVVIYLHGGDYKHPFVLSDHEIRTARFAVDCGANAVAAHHHHVLRGMEWYKGAAIFYGLGHFVFDLQTFRGPEEIVTKGVAARDPETDESYDLAPRIGWPWMPWHRDGRMTALAWVSAESGRIDAAGFLPCMINKKGQVYPVDPASADGQQVLAYVEKGCRTEKLNATFRIDHTTNFAGFDSFEMVRSDGEYEA
jgi:poly-gamma-glutamate synthesis protein (capsule biosynthesis protein)